MKQTLLLILALAGASACCHAQYTIPPMCSELGLGAQPNMGQVCTLWQEGLSTGFVCTCQMAVNNAKAFSVEQYNIKQCNGNGACISAAENKLAASVSADVQLMTYCQTWIADQGPYLANECDSNPDPGGGNPIPAVKDRAWKPKLDGPIPSFQIQPNRPPEGFHFVGECYGSLHECMDQDGYSDIYVQVDEGPGNMPESYDVYAPNN